MIEITIYMAGVIALAVAFAIRTPHQDLRMVVILSLLWPLSLLFALFMSILCSIKWDFDIVMVNEWFSFRKPTNTDVKGFAFTVFKHELQFWKKQ